MNSNEKTTEFASKAQVLFAAKLEIKRYFFTSDGQAFTVENYAELHSKKLTDKTITEVFHPEMSEAEIEEFKATEAAGLQAGADASFERVFPELARNIKANARNPRN
jgi:hypothetical protein